METGAVTRLHFGTALLPDGWRRDVAVTITDGRISDVRSDTPPGSADERHAIAIPGMANVHSHAFQRAMAGRAEHRGPEADDFWTWREAMYRVALAVSPDDVEAIAAQLYAEMLEAGFTRVGEFHYLHHDPDGRPYDNPAEMAERLLAAAATAGIGITILPSFYAHGDFGGAPAAPGQRRFLNDIDGFADILARTRRAAAGLFGAQVGVAPHSLRAVAPGELAALAAMAGNGPIHIHAAEQQKEVTACRAWSGQTPVAWLLDNADVGPGWCLIHATHMDEAETQALARSGAVAGLCPITEANLGDGIFSADAFLGAGGRIAIGSDSNVLIDTAAELRQLEYSQRLRDRMRNVLVAPGRSCGRTLYDAALTGGAQALAQGEAGIAAGSAADIVALRADHPALDGLSGDRLLDAFIFAARGAIDNVWAGGVKRVVDGRHVDRGRIRSRHRQAIDLLITDG